MWEASSSGIRWGVERQKRGMTVRQQQQLKRNRTWATINWSGCGKVMAMGGDIREYFIGKFWIWNVTSLYYDDDHHHHMIPRTRCFDGPDMWVCQWHVPTKSAIDTLKLSSGLIVVATQLWSLYSLWADTAELIYKSEPNRTAKEFAFADMWHTWYIQPSTSVCPFPELPHLCNRMERTFYKYKYTSVFQYPLKYWHVQQKWEQQK